MGINLPLVLSQHLLFGCIETQRFLFDSDVNSWQIFETFDQISFPLRKDELLAWQLVSLKFNFFTQKIRLSFFAFSKKIGNVNKLLFLNTRVTWFYLLLFITELITFYYIKQIKSTSPSLYLIWAQKQMDLGTLWESQPLSWELNHHSPLTRPFFILISGKTIKSKGTQYTHTILLG